MEKKELIKLMHQTDCLDGQHYGSLWIEKLTEFAKLVAAKEREECARICEDMGTVFKVDPDDCAAAIRSKK